MREYDLVVIGAGPAGIALCAEARQAGVPAERTVVLEKGQIHSWNIRKFYPEGKPVTANFKGIEARCEGVLCIPDLSREAAISYLDRAIRESGVEVRYEEPVRRIGRREDGLLEVEASAETYVAPVVVIAIGILERPNKPSHPIPAAVRDKVHFEVTSEAMEGLDVLVVGGGDTAAEYAQFLVQRGNRVVLSYRGRELNRPNPINRDSVLALESRGELRILWGSNTQALEAAGGKVSVSFAEPEHAPLPVDRVVFSLGGSTPENFLRAAGIEYDGPNPKLTEGFATSVPGLFLAGDLTAGRKGGSIILAFNSAAQAMRQICQDHGICRRTPIVPTGLDPIET